MKYIKTKIISFLLIIVIVLVVFFTTVLNVKHERYVFFFKNSFNAKIETEIRYLPKQDIKPKVEAFIEDLILGPVNHDCYPIIKASESLLSYFERHGILYLNFPKTVTDSLKSGFDWDDLTSLLGKNIFTNFKDIEKIIIFIEGKEIYELLKK